MWVRPSIFGAQRFISVHSDACAWTALVPCCVSCPCEQPDAPSVCPCRRKNARVRPSVGLATDGSPAALVPLHDSSVWCAAENSHALAPSTRARNVDLRHRRHRHLLLLVFFNADNNHVSPTRAPCAHNRAAVRAADHAARAGQPPLLSVPSARRARARVARSRSASALRPTPRAVGNGRRITEELCSCGGRVGNGGASSGGDSSAAATRRAVVCGGARRRGDRQAGCWLA